MAIQKKITEVTPAAIDHLMQHPWPGNIRELQNVLEKAVILTKSRSLSVSDLRLERDGWTVESQPNEQKFSLDVSLHQWIREQEKTYLVHKLKSFGGRIDLTAKSCGVDVRTLHRKMQIYRLDRKLFNKPRVLLFVAGLMTNFSFPIADW